MTTQTTSTDANITLVRAAFAELNANDLDACMARLTPNFVINYAEMQGSLHGRDVWRKGVELMKRAFPDLHARIDDTVAAQDRVALRPTFSGTHSEEFQGFPATGRAIEYVSYELYRVVDRLIAEEWICSDMASLFQQLR